MKYLSVKKMLLGLGLFVLSSGFTHAATLNIVTKYGKTGELKGILNSIGDTHNGINICPAVNTNANGTPGCDMDSDSGFNDGGTPDDGSDDTYSGDLIVRTHDAFEAVAGWNWGNNLGDGEEVVTITGTLPSGTGANFPFEWDSLSSTCDSGSSISADGQTITCVRRDFDTNDVGSYSEDLSFAVKVRGGAMNGEQPGDVSFQVSSLNAPSVSDDTNNTSIIVTAAPRWNIEKEILSQPTKDHFNGTSTGYLMRYVFTFGVMEIAGETHTAPGILGNEGLGENVSISFTDDLSTVSPNAELESCNITQTAPGTKPHFSYNTAFPQRSVASIAPLINCNSVGSVVTLTLSDIDASLNHFPTQSRSGGSLPVTDFIAGVMYMYVFVPYSDVIDGNDGISGNSDDTELDTVNTVSGFDPISQSGVSNFGANTESISDNTETRELTLVDSTPAKRYVDFVGDEAFLYVFDGNIRMIDDGFINARLSFTNNGVISIPDVQMCDVFDANYMELVPSGATGNILDPYIMGFLSNGAPVDVTIEYASTYVDDSVLLSNGGDNTLSYATQTVAECNIENTVGSTIWHATPAAALADPNSIGAVTKFRVKANPGFEVPPGTAFKIWSRFDARELDLSGTPVPLGSILANRYVTYDAYDSPNGRSFYRPRDETTNAIGSLGDRILTTGAKVRIVKDANLTNVNIGDIVTFTLTGSLTNDSGTGTGQHQVIIKDLLPPGLDYLDASTSGANEPNIGTCADVVDISAPCTTDHTVLLWDLGILPVNQTIPTISYQTVVAADVPSGVSENWVIIESPSDVSPADIRDDNRNINVVIPSSLLILKTLESDPVVLRDVSPGRFQVGLRNGSNTVLSNLDVIDVLPFNGDNTTGVPFTVAGVTDTRQRSPATNFSGTQDFVSMGLSGVCTGTPTYWFTDQDPTTVDLAPSHTTNTTGGGAPTSIWCQGTSTGPNAGCGYTNAVVTAVRIRGTNMPADGACFLDVVTDVAGNADGDVYTNNAGAFASGVSNPVLSNDVTYRVVDDSRSLGDFVWIDTNMNGVQNIGEFGYSGATLNLLNASGAVIDTTQTNASGAYLFEGLSDGNYEVEIFTPVGYTLSPTGGGTSSTDSNFSRTNERSGTIVLSGADDLTIDAGIFIPTNMSLGGTIWYDTNDDTVFATGSELTASGVITQLYSDSNGNGEYNVGDSFLGTGSTDSSGNYLFTSLSAGEYIVVIPASNFATGGILSGYRSSNDTLPIADPDNNTKNQDNGESQGALVAAMAITLAQGTEPIDDGDSDDNSNLTVDFGVYQPLGAISGSVFEDTTGNGLGDRSFSGVTLSLFADANSDGVADSATALTTTQTNASGAYIFSSLVFGDYVVAQSQPSGYDNISQNEGGADNDSNTGSIIINTLSARVDASDSLNASSQREDSNNDFVEGLSSISLIKSITGVVDVNTNNTIDENDIIQYGFEVENTGVTILTNITIDDSKLNLVSALCSTGPLAPNASATCTATGSYVIGSTDVTAGYVVNSASTSANSQSPVDGTPGTSVTDVSDTGTEPTTPGSFTGVLNPEGVETSDPDPLIVDNDLDFTEDPTTLTLSPQGGISGSVTLDTTGNGVGNQTLAGVAIQLFQDINNDGQADSVTPYATTNTSATGTYLFSNLPFGRYVIVEVQPSQYASISQNEGGSDNDSTIPLIRENTLTAFVNSSDPGATDTNNDFVEAVQLNIGDYIWLDTDQDGVQDLNELGYSGATLTLLSSTGGTLATTQTNSSGAYLFSGLEAGTYQVRFTLPSGYTGSPTGLGTSSTDSNFNVTTGLSGNIVLTTGDDLTIDGGIYAPLGSISGQVTVDQDGDSVGDLPLSGVELSLYADVDANGIADDTIVVATATTNASGSYLFENILYGDYIIVETQPSNYSDVTQNEGGDDNDSNAATPVTNVLSVNVGPSDIGGVDNGNDFVERRISSGGGSSRRTTPPIETPTPPEEPEEPEEPAIPEELTPPEAPIPLPKDLQEKLTKFSSPVVITRQVPKIVPQEGLSLLKALPRELPRTGTPIFERVETRIQAGVDISLPSADTFRLAGSTNNDVNYWKQVLPEIDRNAQKYIVIPSNGMVVPINEFGEGSADFTNMINGREGNINPSLRSGALEYPGASARGYGEIGNKVIFGHSSYYSNAQGRYKTHFQKIIELDAGEEIWIYEKSGNGSYNQYKYKTERSYNTADTDTSVLLPGEGKNLTLFTCTPIGGIEGRWIIKAKYIEETESSSQIVDGISYETVTETRDYFYNLSPRYKRVVQNFIRQIQISADRELVLRVYERVEDLLPQYEDNTEITLLLEYLQYRIIIDILDM